MLFNSHEYLFFFLPVTLIVYFLLNRLVRPVLVARLWLVGASLAFYGWSEPGYLLILVCAVLFNFSFGSVLNALGEQHAAKRRTVLVLGIAADILLLCYYKYIDFIIMNANYLLHTQIAPRSLALPLGLSFITFIQIGYLVDSYRTPMKGSDLPDYALFGTYFPYILAGPIVTRSDIFPQLKRTVRETVNYRNLSLGLYLLSIGLFKKAVVADRFALWANDGFAAPEPFNFLYAWVTSLCYTLQIYFDFSGYTDMALGSALMFNIRLPINFDSPYKALTIQDFWRRWHITLGRFLREYIYIPLGGSRVNEGRVYFNLIVTFLICGIWHGAGWTFVFWGFLHGAGLVLQRLWRRLGGKMPGIVAWLLTFIFVNTAWVFFRARTWDEALKVIRGMFGFNGFALPEGWAQALGFLKGPYVHFMPWKSIMQGSRDACMWVPVALAACLVLKNSNEMAVNFKPGWKSLLVIAAGAYAALQLFRINEFLYFNF